MSKNSMVPVFPVGEFLASGEPLDPAPDVSGFSVWIDLKVLIAKLPFAKLRLLRCAKRNRTATRGVIVSDLAPTPGMR